MSRPAIDPDLELHLRHLEEQLLQFEVRHDAARLMTLLAPDFCEFGSSGRTFTRDQILADLAAEPSTATITLSDFHLLARTAAWALVTYRSHRHDSVTGLHRIALRSSTWIYREARWQMLFHQGTLTPSGALS